MGGSRAGVKARRGQQPRPDQWAPAFVEIVGAGVRRLRRGVGAAGRGWGICNCKKEAGSRRGALVTVWKKRRGWDTASVFLGVGVRNP